MALFRNNQLHADTAHAKRVLRNLTKQDWHRGEIRTIHLGLSETQDCYLDTATDATHAEQNRPSASKIRKILTANKIKWAEAPVEFQPNITRFFVSAQEIPQHLLNHAAQIASERGILSDISGRNSTPSSGADSEIDSAGAETMIDDDTPAAMRAHQQLRDGLNLVLKRLRISEGAAHWIYDPGSSHYLLATPSKPHVDHEDNIERALGITGRIVAALDELRVHHTKPDLLQGECLSVPATHENAQKLDALLNPGTSTATTHTQRQASKPPSVRPTR